MDAPARRRTDSREVIERVSGGTMSTPEEMYQKAVSSADTMFEHELRLVLDSFHETKPMYDVRYRMCWTAKLGRMGGIALNLITTDLESRAHQRAAHILVIDEGYKAKRREAEERLLRGNPDLNKQRVEEHRASHGRNSQEAAERAQRLEEWDKRLFAGTAEVMRRMADEITD